LEGRVYPGQVFGLVGGALAGAGLFGRAPETGAAGIAILGQLPGHNQRLEPGSAWAPATAAALGQAHSVQLPAGPLESGGLTPLSVSGQGPSAGLQAAPLSTAADVLTCTWIADPFAGLGSLPETTGRIPPREPGVEPARPVSSGGYSGGAAASPEGGISRTSPAATEPAAGVASTPATLQAATLEALAAAGAAARVQASTTTSATLVRPTPGPVAAGPATRAAPINRPANPPSQGASPDLLTAQTIPGLYNTGVDDAGNLLLDAAPDPHYQMTVSADPDYPAPRAPVVVTDDGNYPWDQYWLHNGPDSKWIGPRTDAGAPTPDGGNGNSPGDYVYETTFDMTGLDASTAIITGQWATDNLGQIVINGADSSVAITSETDYGHLTAFTIYGGFLPGKNVLDFRVHNDDPEDLYTPTGLRVEMSGTAEPAQPPDNPPNTGCGCGCNTDLIQSAPSSSGSSNSTDASQAMVRYDDGTVEMSTSDLSSAGFGTSWGQTRSWTNTPGYDAHSFNGTGMVDMQMPYVLETNGDNSTIAVVSNGYTARYFDLVGSSYVPRNFDQDQFTYDSGTSEFTLTDTTANQLYFYDFSGNVPENQQGQMDRFVDPDGNLTRFHYDATGSLADVDRSQTTGGHTITETYAYTYGTTGLLTNVTLERQTDGGSEMIVRQVQYTYYAAGEPYDNLGDLKTATLEDQNNTPLDTDYYRYYTPDDIVDGQGNVIGFVHGLKYSYDYDSYARLVSAVGDPTIATDDQVAPYATDNFQYDAQRRVIQAVVQGSGCTACTGGQGTYTYSYIESGNAPGYNSWATKTVETLPDGNQNYVYSNSHGEVMLQVYADQPTGQQWETFYQYDSQGRTVLMANPSALSGYDESTPDLLNRDGSGHYQCLYDHDGLIRTTTYYDDTTATETMPGHAAGYMAGEAIEHGQLAAPIPQSSMDYFAHTSGGATIYPQADQTVYRNDDGTRGATTQYSYTYFPATTRVQTMTTTMPTVYDAENGPGTPDVTMTTYDSYGRAASRTDPDGFVTMYTYDPATSAVTQVVEDATGLGLVTQYCVDDLGRTTKTTDPNGNVTYTVYDDPGHEVRVYPGWNSATNMPTGPTQVTRDDRIHSPSYTETLTMSTAPHVTNGEPDGTEPIDNVQTLSRTFTSLGGQVIEDDEYFAVSGLVYTTDPYLGSACQVNPDGTVTGNYWPTMNSYDHRGRLDRVEDPTGTVTRTVYDGLSRIVETDVGTSDDNLVMTTQSVYDNGGVGDSNRTQFTQFPGGGADPRVTQNYYDWRDRLVAEKDGVQTNETDGTHRPIMYSTYDNLNEPTSRSQYDGDGVMITTTNGVPDAPPANLLRAYTTSSYDDQGRVYRTNTHSVDQNNGTISTNSLKADTFYDHRGNVIETAEPGGLVTKTQYDGVGRATRTYTTDGGSGTDWNAANTVSGDMVLEQMETTYDGDGNVILTTDRQRFHDATVTGALGTPTSGVHARVSFVAAYYDAANRTVATVDVGTNGGMPYTRPAMVPARSDTVLVTSYDYNDAGWVQDTVDPRGIVTRTEYDALQRTTAAIANYTGNPETDSSDIRTEYTYDGVGDVVTQTALQPAGTVAQVTQYVYGVTPDGGSALNSNDLLAATLYPDPMTGLPSPNQQETYSYNALGQRLTYVDRNMTMHQYTYDVLGRQTADAVTIPPGSTVDTHTQRLETAYDTGGRPYLYTSYDATTGGNIVNQIEQVYNGLSQLITEYQSHAGAVDVSTTPKVQYSYSEMAGGANHSRLTRMTYPNGRTVHYNYAAGLDDRISRLSSISDNSGTLESYLYLGLNTAVERDHPQTAVNLTYISPTGGTGDAGDQYTGLDRFGRGVEQLWVNPNTHAATDDFQYSYDRDGNVLTKNNLLHPALNETYSYDNLNRLVSFARGSHTQTWVLDAEGNWLIFTNDGVPQPMSYNAQNQKSGLNYDANGNTTTDQSGNALVYDAWNRLVAVQNSGGNPLAAYSYDALGRRIQETRTQATRDLYFSEQWQVLEEDQTIGTTMVLDQYVWSPVYVDGMVERDAGGQRLYAQENANWNVTAVVDTTGTVQERYIFDPYGQPTVLAPDWSTRGTSMFSWIYLHQGARYDNATGLYDFRERAYSSTLGRWTQQDPLRYADTTNLYDYEQNRPPDLVDPWGLAGCCRITGVHFVGQIRVLGFALPAFSPFLPGSLRRIVERQAVDAAMNPNTPPPRNLAAAPGRLGGTAGFQGNAIRDIEHVVWVVWTGENLSDCVFERCVSSTEERSGMKPTLVGFGGFLGSKVKDPDPVNVLSTENLAVVLHAVGLKALRPRDLPASFMGSYDLVASSRTDGTVKGRVSYNIVISAGIGGRIVSSLASLTQSQIAPRLGFRIGK
jgi:RHS repeat-associated protein